MLRSVTKTLENRSEIDRAPIHRQRGFVHGLGERRMGMDVRARSSALASKAMARTASADEFGGFGCEDMYPQDASVSASARTLTRPAVSPMARARPLAWSGKRPRRNSAPFVFSACSLGPTQAISGQV